MTKEISCPKCKEKHDGERSEYIIIEFCRCPHCDQQFFRKSGDFVPPDFEEKVMGFAATYLKDFQVAAAQNQ
jgi:hypothetical protein